ncbi:hypothetical protein FFLO_05360 [Filobasidium floriforme]|uniref:Uncharacterized protein n=1 Tax=Filobasidium floriforme TaxID=5210 RepID=A0A8K0NP13_9TREE|nr:uncharacterized protein HD553DRAFT_370269 [Filobasidium floriforme]KAG7529870.1 hypothetical protein FFLO_05360 [Filobasidium floriforme]KAH8085778.1 hypothetical protein HD553DRAFT_370269 [Filobasidium floriforme]
MEGRSTGEKEWGHKEYLERERSSRITAVIVVIALLIDVDLILPVLGVVTVVLRLRPVDGLLRPPIPAPISDTEKKSEHLLKDPAEAEKSEGASKGPAEDDASKSLKDALHLFRVRSDAFAKHLLDAQQMVIKNRVELYEMDPAPPQSYSGKPTGEEWVDQEAMLRIDVNRWGASTVKTEDQGRRTLEENFFESFVPRPKQVVHKDILRNYPILAAYVFRSMGRQNLQRRAGDAMYTTPSDAQQQYCQKIMHGIFRQMEAACTRLSAPKARPGEASGSGKRKRSDSPPAEKPSPEKRSRDMTGDRDHQHSVQAKSNTSERGNSS